MILRAATKDQTKLKHCSKFLTFAQKGVDLCRGRCANYILSEGRHNNGSELPESKLYCKIIQLYTKTVGTQDVCIIDL